MSVLSDEDILRLELEIEGTSFFNLSFADRNLFLAKLVNLPEKSGGPIFRRFLRKNGITTRLSSSTQIDGFPARRLSETGDSWDAFLFSRDNERRFFEIPQLATDKRGALEAVETLYGISLMDERNRGLADPRVHTMPRLRRFGFLDVEKADDSRWFYIESDEARPEEHFLSVEEILKLNPTEQKAYLEKKSNQTTAPEKMADALIDNFMYGLEAWGGEILVNQEGDIVWVNGKHWTQEITRSSLIEATGKQVNLVLRSLVPHPAAPVFLLRFLGRLKGLHLFEEKEKIQIVKEIARTLESHLTTEEIKGLYQKVSIATGEYDYRKEIQYLLDYYTNQAAPISLAPRPKQP